MLGIGQGYGAGLHHALRGSLLIAMVIGVYRARMERSLALAAIVLAAGAGSRYSDEPGAKLLAEIDGDPVLAHVLRAVRDFAPGSTVVVLGEGGDRIEQAIAWQAEIRVRNQQPRRGLASSLQIGLDALGAMPTSFDGTFIVLGDQPLLRAEVMRDLAAAAIAARPADRPIVLPSYTSSAGPRNPALLLRPAWSWVDHMEGDHGLAPLIAERPDAVLTVAVSGEMPDVDTLDDLRRLRASTSAAPRRATRETS
jgi:molybdenum cofactor cytidylyltransferase